MLLFLLSFRGLGLDLKKFVRRLSNLGPVLSRMARLDLSVLPDALLGMLTSPTLAFVSLCIGALLNRSIYQYNYAVTTTLILVIFLSMFLLEFAAGALKRRITRAQ